MLDPIKEIYKYIRVFEKFLGKRIYLIFFLGLIAALSEGIGILMLLPLLESLDGNFDATLISHDNLNDKIAVDHLTGG